MLIDQMLFGYEVVQWLILQGIADAEEVKVIAHVLELYYLTHQSQQDPRL
jgi:hypothetical protein